VPDSSPDSQRLEHPSSQHPAGDIAQQARYAFFSSLLFALSACRPFREIFELMSRPLNLLWPTSAHARNRQVLTTEAESW